MVRRSDPHGVSGPPGSGWTRENLPLTATRPLAVSARGALSMVRPCPATRRAAVADDPPEAAPPEGPPDRYLRPACPRGGSALRRPGRGPFRRPTEPDRRRGFGPAPATRAPRTSDVQDPRRRSGGPGRRLLRPHPGRPEIGRARRRRPVPPARPRSERSGSPGVPSGFDHRSGGVVDFYTRPQGRARACGELFSATKPLGAQRVSSLSTVCGRSCGERVQNGRGAVDSLCTHRLPDVHKVWITPDGGRPTPDCDGQKNLGQGRARSPPRDAGGPFGRAGDGPPGGPLAGPRVSL